MKLKKVAALALAGTMVLSSLTACGNKNTSADPTKAPDATKSAEATKAADATKAPEATKPAETKKVSLKVWGPQEDQAPITGYDKGLLPGLCEKFNAAHPEWDITFEYGVCSEGEAKDNVTKDVASSADVYAFANDQIPVLVNAGAIAELGGNTLDAIKSSNSESMLTSVTFKGGVYGVPYSPNTWFMFYDKSKYTEDEVKSLDKMMAKDLGSDVTNFAFPLEDSWYVGSFFYAAGGTLFGDGTDASKGCTFGGDLGLNVAKYLIDLAKNPKFSNEKDNSSIAKFKEGKLGAFCSGSWDAKDIKEALGDNFAVTKIPTVTINGKEGQLRSFAGSKAFGVNPNCKEPQVAVALANYLGSEEAQQIRFDTRTITPTNLKVAESAAVKANEVASAEALEIKDASVCQPVLDEMGKYWDPAKSFGKEITQGDITADNAAEKVESLVNGILGK